MVSFGTFADAVCPLTLDHGNLMSIVDDLEAPEPAQFQWLLHAGDKFQLERIGFFCIDPDTTAEKLVLNRTVALKILPDDP